MGRTTDEKGSDKAQAIRRTQQKDRSRILQEIQQSQTTIAKYSEERAPLSNELKKIEADVGPIKYIAALLYNQAVDVDIIDKAVRLVILLIIVVFDPLAVLLLIASNQTYQKLKEPVEIEPVKKAKKKKTLDNTNTNSLESFFIDDKNEVIPKTQIIKMDGEFK